MATNTSTLSQISMNRSNVSQNNGGRGMMIRRMLPALLFNAVVPFMINMLVGPYMSGIEALLLASSAPALFTLVSFVWKKHIDIMGLLVVVGLLLTAAFALLFNSPQLLLLQSSSVNGLFGAALLVSLLFPRPILFYLVRSIQTQGDPQSVASFNADWAFPQFRSFYHVMTIVWGCLTVGHVILMVLLVFNLPIPLMLVLSPILNFGLIIPAAHWSMIYLRKNKRVIDQLRQERDAKAC